jgi:hypothetical protein
VAPIGEILPTALRRTQGKWDKASAAGQNDAAITSCFGGFLHRSCLNCRVRDDPGAAERRRQLANSTLLVGGFSAVRGFMEDYVYATRGVPWWSVSADAAIVGSCWRRSPPERSCSPAGSRSAEPDRACLVHVFASMAFGPAHVVGITRSACCWQARR